MTPRNSVIRSLTLGEVLLIVWVLLILVGFFVPARRHVHGMQPCTANLSQIGKAVYLYAENNGGYCPFLADRAATDSLALIYPDYLTTPSVFRCPQSKDQPSLGIRVDSELKVINRRFGRKPAWSSYGYDPEMDPRAASSLQPIIADMDGSSVASPASSTANHDGGQNVLYFDTHVGWKTTNVWDNHGIADNIFTPDLGGGDTDTFIRR